MNQLEKNYLDAVIDAKGHDAIMKAIKDLEAADGAKEKRRSEAKRLVIFVSVMYVVCLSIGALILIKHFEEGVQTAEAKAYKQGYKDALYKRPVSNDLEMVCAGLWVGQENLKYQQQEMKK